MSEVSFEETSKGKEFRVYLEKSKVMKTISDILLELYYEETKPERPLKYVMQKLQDDCNPDSCQWELKLRVAEASFQKEAVLSTVMELRCRNAALRETIKKLTTKSVEPPVIKEEVKVRKPRPTSTRTIQSLKLKTSLKRSRQYVLL